MPYVLIVHLLTCALMAGLCLFVAVVHYPMFASVGRAEFAAYSQEHARRTTIVVAPLMLLEAATGVWLILQPPIGGPGWWPWVNAAGLGVCWVVTFALNVPQHGRLAKGFDAPTHRALVATHWIRTLVWLVRATGAAVILALVVRS